MEDRRRLLLTRRRDIPPTYRLVAMALLDAEDNDGIIADLTQRDIARTVGMHRQYVSHILRELRDRDVIAFDHKPHHPGVYRFIGEYAPEGVVA